MPSAESINIADQLIVHWMIDFPAAARLSNRVLEALTDRIAQAIDDVHNEYGEDEK